MEAVSNMTPAEVAAWESLAQDGSLSEHAGRCERAGGRYLGWAELDPEYELALAFRVSEQRAGALATARASDSRCAS